ncbi:DUF3306 domain-containing protein [Nitrogeniibacter mangrovi]|uniref:DUF3306 domain-containing protein n=1 Tax=Nitrogeniibacter mangrovi TaxID=2016596 RepID=A0A6C1B099_9RHOO|nr:DUF3306 domain-containing protein [Nitrogeniibacter mangrovi]QID16325.1 DUF3306 domain-containing protein [Nitrogeniibacter mangrovi]
MADPDTDATHTPAAEDAGFLRRWSQRKHAVARGEAPVEPPVTPPAAPPVQDDTPLPDPATLTLADDFSAFLGEQVSPALKRKAMQHLFSHAVFNEVDGLDVYMEDFNAVPNLDSASLALARHARAVLEPATGEENADDEASAADETPVVTDAGTEARDTTPPVSGDSEDRAAPETPAAGEDGRPESV